MSDYWKDIWAKKSIATQTPEKLLQVRRTLNGAPISQDEVDFICASICNALSLNERDDVLDLCCGNGLLTPSLLARARSVVAVDFSLPLITSLRTEMADTDPQRLQILHADAMALNFAPSQFQKIVMAGALQHFTLSQTVVLFKRMAQWLMPEGCLLLTDITDQSRMWNFHDTPQRAGAHFERLAVDQPLLGTWFDPIWLYKLAEHAGFSQVQLRPQPPQRSCAHYRFDLLCLK
jgi:cyclopropane fatty-acyl-phospholipid synthase-like methyltransferase